MPHGMDRRLISILEIFNRSLAQHFWALTSLPSFLVQPQPKFQEDLHSILHLGSE